MNMRGFEKKKVLPVTLSSKLLPEMDMEDNTKKEQLLHGMLGLPVAAQFDKLKTRIDIIGAACESADKIIVDARKASFGTRQGTNLLPTVDKVQAAKIQEQENLQSAFRGEGTNSLLTRTALNFLYQIFAFLAQLLLPDFI